MVAPSWNWPEQWYSTNLVAKTKILNFVNKHHFCQKYIRISTPEVYGSTEKLITEEAHYNPTTPYSISHAAIDMHLAAYNRYHKFPMVIARFANFFGPTQQLFRIVPRAFISSALGDKLPLHGGGNSIRSFIYGSDVAEAILLLIEKGDLGKTYHFSTDNFVSIRDLVEEVAIISGTKFDDLVEVTEDRLGKDAAYLMSSERAKHELGWCPKVELTDGLKRTHKWVVENIQKISQMDLEYTHKE